MCPEWTVFSQSGRVDLNHRPPGPEAATKDTDIRRNVVLTRCSGQSESYLGSRNRCVVARNSHRNSHHERPPGPISGGRSSCEVALLAWFGSSNIATSPPLAQCHLLATTKRCDRPKNVTPVRGLEPATPEPHANRQRTELRLGSRARLSPSTRGTHRAADGAGGAGWRSGRGTPCRTGHPGARSPGASPVS